MKRSFRRIAEYTKGGFARNAGMGARIYLVVGVEPVCLETYGQTGAGNFQYAKRKRCFKLTPANCTWYEPVEEFWYE